MLRRQLFSRTMPFGSLASVGFVGACGVAALLLSSTEAQAAGVTAKEKKACMAAYTAYKSAVDREKAGHLREARDLLQTCQQSACAGLVPKCTLKSSQLAAQMPSVVPVVTDDSGAPKVDVQVKMDGELLTSQLDGKGLSVEAGLHEFTFATDAGVFATEKIMIVEGQRNRTIPVVIHTGGPPKGAAVSAAPEEPKPEPAPGEPKSAAPEAVSEKTAHPPEAGTEGHPVVGEHWAMPRSAVPYIIAGVGVASLVSGGLLTFWGKKDNDALVAECGQTQSCQQSSVDHVRTLYVASDITIGAGVLALGIATWMFASSRAPDEVPHTAYKFDVQPTRSGAFASMSGSF